MAERTPLMITRGAFHEHRSEESASAYATEAAKQEQPIRDACAIELAFHGYKTQAETARGKP